MMVTGTRRHAKGNEWNLVILFADRNTVSELCNECFKECKSLHRRLSGLAVHLGAMTAPLSNEVSISLEHQL